MLLAKSLGTAGVVSTVLTIDHAVSGTGTDWQGIATLVTAIGSLVSAVIAGWVALRKRTSTEERLLKLLEQKAREDITAEQEMLHAVDDLEVPKRRRRR
jgi:uncharacterized membrane protein YccC